MADEPKFKYYAKVELGKKKTRYFYSKAEYLAYLNKNKVGVDKNNKNLLSSLFKSITKSISNKAAKAKKSVSSFVTKGKTTVNKLLIKNVNSSKPLSSAIKAFASKGKKSIDKIVNASAIKGKTASIKSKFSKLSENGKAAASNFLNSSMKIAEKTVRKGKTAVGKILPKASKVDISIDGLKSSVSDVKKSLSKLAKKGESAAMSAVKKIGTKKTSDPKVTGFATNLSDKVSSWLKDTADTIKGFAQNVVQNITQILHPISNESNDTDSPKSFLMQAQEFFFDYAENPNAWKQWKLEDLPKKQSEMSPEEDMAAVNPYYESGLDMYTNNCIFCTTAYDMRRRGYDVSAIPKQSHYTIENAAEWYEPPAKVKEYEGTSDLEKKLLKEGEGASGNLALYWAQGGGHSVYWEVKNGEVVIRDAQTNKVQKVEDFEGYLGDYGHYIRTDNLDLDHTVMETIIRNDKKKKE